MKVERECPICHKIYFVEQSRLKHGRGATCSRECQYKSNSLKNRVKLADGSPAPLFVDLICAACGKPFQVERSQYDHLVKIGKPTQYCSKECRFHSQIHHDKLSAALKASPKAQLAAKINATKMVASNRLPENRAKKSDILKANWQNPELRARIMTGIKQRSLNPDWQNAPHFQRGENSPFFKGGHTERYTIARRYNYRQWRKAVFERDSYTCQVCGAQGEDVKLHAHHIKSFKDYPELIWDLDNGKTMCSKCHYATLRKS